MTIPFVSVQDICSIELHIYVLGYYPIGESVLVVVWDKMEKRVLKSVLFDCYEESGGVNRIMDILDYYGLKERKLDFVVWTHPDKDHSVGFEKLLKKYTDKKTIALLPEGVTKRVFDLSLFGIYRVFKVKKKENLFKKLIVERISCSNNRTYPDEYGATSYYDGGHDPLPFALEIVTPFSDLLYTKTEVNKSFIKNDLSSSVILKFGDYSFYFGGDAQNDALSKVDSSKWENVVFVKIPHHASESSDKLPVLLERVQDINKTGRITAVSTSFASGKSHLPEKTVLTLYNKISDCVLLTQNNVHANNYGIWNCSYSIMPFGQLRQKAEGDASEWFRRKAVKAERK